VSPFVDRLFDPESLDTLDGAIAGVLDGVGPWGSRRHQERKKGIRVMKKTNGFVLAVVMLLLVPGCKPDTPPPQAEGPPPEVKGSLADTKRDVEPSTPDTPPPQAEEAPAGAKESLADTQSDVEPSAKEAADRFLKALKSMDTPEGKKTLAETRWRQTMKFPQYQDITLLSEEMFSTDIPGVKGYKQVARLAIPREGGRPFVKRYMLIAYEDTKKMTWKVFDFTDVGGRSDGPSRPSYALQLLADDDR